jgi:hypothetical protein
MLGRYLMVRSLYMVASRPWCKEILAYGQPFYPMKSLTPLVVTLFASISTACM